MISFSFSFEEKEISFHSCGSRTRPPPAATPTAMPTERLAQARPRVVLRALVAPAVKAAASRLHAINTKRHRIRRRRPRPSWGRPRRHPAQTATSTTGCPLTHPAPMASSVAMMGATAWASGADNLVHCRAHGEDEVATLSGSQSINAPRRQRPLATASQWRCCRCGKAPRRHAASRERRCLSPRGSSGGSRHPPRDRHMARTPCASSLLPDREDDCGVL